MKVGSIEGMVQQSQGLKDVKSTQDRQISVAKKMRDGQEQAVSKLLSNAFSGVGQVVNKSL
jgi:hypothetical protein